MEIIANTEYQDIYRLDYGVLLIVDKFIIDKQYGNYCDLRSRGLKTKSYAKGTDLKVLKVDTLYEERYVNNPKAHTVPKGTILYHDRPVKLADKWQWRFKVKTTGESFSGDVKYMLEKLDRIKEVVNKAL